MFLGLSFYPALSFTASLVLIRSTKSHYTCFGLHYVLIVIFVWLICLETGPSWVTQAGPQLKIALVQLPTVCHHWFNSGRCSSELCWGKERYGLRLICYVFTTIIDGSHSETFWSWAPWGVLCCSISLLRTIKAVLDGSFHTIRSVTAETEQYRCC